MKAIPRPLPTALQELLSQTPVRTGTSRRSAVRQVMDANADTFMKLAELGHSSTAVAEAFMASFPDIRSSRQDLADEAFKTHVMTTYDSFKRKLRQHGSLQKPKAKKKAAARHSGTLKEKQVQKAVAIEPPAPTIEPVAATEVDDAEDFIDLKPVAAPVVLPTDGGFKVPKISDL